LGGEIKLQGGEDPTAMEIRPAGLVLIAPQNLVVVSREGQVKQQVYYPAPQLPGLLRALYRLNAVRAGLYGAAASAYGDAFAQASHNATDTTARRITGQLATAYSTGGAQLPGYSHQAASLASKRFNAALAVVLVVYLTSSGLTPSQSGMLMTLTLVGDTAVSLYLTTRADRLGRRRMLIVGAILMVAAGMTFAWTRDFLLLVVAGTIGVISPSGNEVGPFLPIEQAALAHVVPADARP